MTAPNSLFVWPFVGLLGSIALLPVIAPKLWEHKHERIALLWALASVIPGIAVLGFGVVADSVLHALLSEYLPFIVIAFVLYVIAGEVRVSGRLSGTPLGNSILLLIGTVLASLMGTTGASMLLVRPLLRANARRRQRVHQVVFLIFLVCNAGGALTPLGDPPLFLGFLKGVSFGWTFAHLWSPTLVLSGALLSVFFILDRHYWMREGSPVGDSSGGKLRIQGGVHAALLLVCACIVLASGLFRDHELFRDTEAAAFHEPRLAEAESQLREAQARASVAGGCEDILRARARLNELRALQEASAQRGLSFGTVHLSWLQLLRDGLLVLCAFISLALVPPRIRRSDGFTWAPVREVAVLFAAIFITMAPVIQMLQAGVDGPFAQLILGVVRADGSPIPFSYYCATGVLSAFLDNAPTYLVFFNMAGGEAQALMNEVSALAAISAGAVFFGAMTYVGNAPNFMVRSIAASEGVLMPSFFGYLSRWSVPFLLPLLLLLGWCFLA
jgi:Na+/H+ antiporter NhaD/arsenite permease-like protein